MSDLKYDLYRIIGKIDRYSFFKTFLKNRMFRRLVYHRQIQKSKGIKRMLLKIMRHFLIDRMSVEIPDTAVIGKGALFIHPYSEYFAD